MVSKRIEPLLLLTIALALQAGVSGCGLLGSGKLQQCQSESERLLLDYRQQRDRADRLEDQNRVIADRLAQLEQRLAQLQESPETRLATRPAEPPSVTPAPADVAPPADAEPPADASPPADVPVPDPWRAGSRERS